MTSLSAGPGSSPSPGEMSGRPFQKGPNYTKTEMVGEEEAYPVKLRAGPRHVGCGTGQAPGH